MPDTEELGQPEGGTGGTHDATRLDNTDKGKLNARATLIQGKLLHDEDKGDHATLRLVLARIVGVMSRHKTMKTMAEAIKAVATLMDDNTANDMASKVTERIREQLSAQFDRAEKAAEYI
jgi:hypothetical protein